MRRVALCLAVIGLLAGGASTAWAGWVWRDGKWTYVEPSKPPPPEKPVEPPREPVAPSPKPAEPAEPAPPAPKPVVPTEPAPPPAPKPVVPAEPAPPPPKPAVPAEPAPPPAPKPVVPAEPPPPAPKPVVLTEPAPPPAPKPAAPAEPAPDDTGRSGFNWRFWQRKPDPNTDRPLFEDGKASMAAGRLSEAARTFKKLIKDYPASACRESAMWLRGGILFDQKDYYKAYEQYEELLTQYAGSTHYRDALLKEIEIAELFLGPVRRRVLGIPLLSGETEAIEILRRVYEHQPAGDLADDVVLRIADYHWAKGQWTEAEDYYDKYCREYPNGDAVLHAELRRAKCAIERCRGPRYDVTSLQLAYDRLNQFQRKFPEEAKREGIPDMIAQVREMQAQALYEIALRYRRGGQPLAAAFYAERLRQRYPDSPWSSMAGEFLADGAAIQGSPAEDPGKQEPTQ